MGVHVRSLEEIRAQADRCARDQALPRPIAEGCAGVPCSRLAAPMSRDPCCAFSSAVSLGCKGAARATGRRYRMRR